MKKGTKIALGLGIVASLAGLVTWAFTSGGKAQAGTQRTVTIGSKAWRVTETTAPADLFSVGLNIKSLPAQTGILFDLGSELPWPFWIPSSQMLFPVDVIWISTDEGSVLGVFPNVTTAGFGPAGPVRYFMVVNAGETAGIGYGNAVSIQKE